MPWRIGTSGWQYPHWRTVLYPPGLAQRAWLSHYAARFDTVEVNTTFYRLPAAQVFAHWAASTPAGFVFAAKMSRFLTHVRRLRDPAEPVTRFFERAAPLGTKLGPVLVQLPPDLPADRARLAELLACWPDGHRLALEARHPSWFSDEVLTLLAAHDAALCLGDRRGRPTAPLVATASWGYVRLHEGRASPWPSYGDRALRSWVHRIGERWPADADVHTYFNNDPTGAAVRDADRFAALARRRGSRGLATLPDGHRPRR